MLDLPDLEGTDPLYTFKPKPSLTLAQEIESRVERGLWIRASGLAICTLCDKEYKNHHVHPLAPEPNDWLTILCSGELVKL